MGIRETINRHSAVSTTVVLAALVVGVFFIAMELRGDSGKPPSKNYFTVDDGKTWFVDSALKLPPYDHDGAQAVRCYVFECKSGKFAGLLQKFDPDTQAALARRPEQGPALFVPVMIKKPGAKDWEKTSIDEQAAALLRITGPDGSDAEPILP